MWISGSLLLFFPTNMPQYYDWPVKVSLKIPCISLKHLGQHQRPHITGGGGRVQLEAPVIQVSSLLFSFPLSLLLQGSCFCAALLKEKDRERGEGDFSSCVYVHHVSWPLLAFMFCLAESPAPAVSVSSLKVSVPQRQETLSPLHPFQLGSV